jgi:hypothetical protein
MTATGGTTTNHQSCSGDAMTTPWGCTRIWADLPEESQAILWTVSDELVSVGLSTFLISPDPAWHQSYQCGLRVFSTHHIASLYHYGSELTVFTSHLGENPQYAVPSATYDLNDPGSIPALVRSLRGMVGVKARDGA